MFMEQKHALSLVETQILLVRFPSADDGAFHGLKNMIQVQ